MMQCLPCLRNVRDRITELIFRQMIRCLTLPQIFVFTIRMYLSVNAMSEI